MSMVFKASFLAAALPYLVQATTYNLKDSYEGTSVTDGFNFLTDADPSGGWVTYVSEATAKNDGLVLSANGASRVGVDHTNVISASGPGRNSIRLSSKNTYDKGLFIFDASHMPGGICGLWPAFWLLGDAASGVWPKTGEWDIVENVNTNTQNQMTAHTDAGCNTNGNGATGQVLESNCNANNAANGCGTLNGDKASWGLPLNNNGGGVWATEWTDSHMATWFFSRNSIPTDIKNKVPNPQNWGEPTAIVSNTDGCNVGTFFPDPMNIIINTDFCGGWAQGQWSNYCQANTGTSSCIDYVANNPKDLQAAYWDINYVRVYEAAGGAPAALASEYAPVNTTDPNIHSPLMGGPGYKGGRNGEL